MGKQFNYRIPSVIAEQIEIKQGSTMEWNFLDNQELQLVKKTTLQELLSQCKPENRHEGIDLKYAGNANKRRFNLFKLNPQAGHEQAGDCFSPKEFNEVTGSLSVCPITHTVKGWGYEVLLPDGWF